jgi:putative ABC transport system permease protein
MLNDYFKMAMDSIRHRGLRTWLTLVGIFIGIATVVALISIGQGLQDAVANEFQKLGTDKIMITPAGQFAPASGSSPLTTDDVKAVLKVKGVAEASYVLINVAQIDWGRDETVYGAVYGIPMDSSRAMIEKTLALEAVQGRMIEPGDDNKVYLGYDYANSAQFKQKIKVGQKVIIKGKEFSVVGINKKIGNEQDDRVMVVTENAYKNLFNPGTKVDMIIVRTEAGVITSDVVAPLEKELRRARNEKVGEEDFQVRTFEELIKSFMTIFSIIQGVLVGIAAISLLVGGIGIMNTMYTSVLERTSDIGVMKAIGARNSDILKMFLIESGLIGLVGGIIGVLLGLGIAKLAEIVGGAALGTPYLKAAMPAWLIIGALLFAFVLGSISGLLPARQASRMSPVDALREE